MIIPSATNSDSKRVSSFAFDDFANVDNACPRRRITSEPNIVETRNAVTRTRGLKWSKEAGHSA